MSMRFLLQIKQFMLKYEQKIVLIVAFCLISAISFGFGVLQGQKWQQKPLVIEKPANIPEVAQTTQNQALAAPQSAQTPKSQQLEAKSSACVFVGSKNSDKFYVPTCTWAKRIKPENLVCYKSEQEALSKGKTKSDCK
ncbi:MAG TPA: hypothetical protein VF817_05245 [Patescibacteria group bacterium]